MNQALFNKLYDTSDLSFVKTVEAEYNQGKFSFYCPNQEANFCDVLAGAYVNSLRVLPNSRSDFLYSQDPLFYKPILLASKSLALIQSKDDPRYIEAQNEDVAGFYGDLGIYYSLRGRYCESLIAFNRALEISPKSGQIRFNKIECVKDYLPMIFRFCQLDPLFYFFKDQLAISLDTLTKPDDEATRQRAKEYLSKMRNVEYKYEQIRFSSNPDLNIYPLNINPVSSLVPLESLTDIAIKEVYDDPRYHELCRSFEFLRMERQEVENGRYDPKIVDRKLANLFGEYFSLFDKVAYFLAKHYSLPIKERNINIESVFEEKYGLLKHKNPFLYSIYWIFKEFRESSVQRINPYIPSDFIAIANQRNQMEHRCEPLENMSDYQITRCCNKMEELDRNMLTYLQMMVIVDAELQEEFGSERPTHEYRLSHIDIADFFGSCIKAESINR